MSAHTPGPWHASALTKSIGIYDPQGTPIARTAIAYGDAHREANARLIAAAPDMYEALKRLMGGTTTMQDAVDAAKQARAAIAKAEGKS